MNDRELAALRKKASQALGKAISHLETTEQERRRATLLFEAKISRCESEQTLQEQRPRLTTTKSWH